MKKNNFYMDFKFLFLLRLVGATALIFVSAGSLLLFSQEKQNSADTKPLELPNFIIEGREQLNVQSGIKQFPEKSTILSKEQMDSLNSLEKQQSLLLPQKPLPGSLMSFDKQNGYAIGQFGRYTTPAIEGGYRFDIAGYNVFANAGYEHSEGNITNAGYNKFFAKVNADYVADEKFLVFGGSKTSTNIGYDLKSYRLYARTDATDRTTGKFLFNLNSEGSYEDFDFSTGAGFKSVSLSQTNSNGSDNSVKGWLKINKEEKDYGFGGNAVLDFHTFRGQAVNSIDIFASGKYNYGVVITHADFGFQTAHNSMNNSRSNLLINAGLNYFLNKSVTLNADVSSSLEKSFFADFLTVNPYVADTVNIDFGNKTEVKFALTFEPSEELKFTAGTSYSLGSRSPYFSQGDTGLFVIEYDKISKFNFFADACWSVTKNDIVIGDISIVKAALSNGNEMPFEAPVNFDLKYRRNWSENFGSDISILYIGSRYSDKFNKFELNSYFDLKIAADYKINRSFRAFASLSNLLNNDIYVWPGYKERDMFFNFGVIWQF